MAKRWENKKWSVLLIILLLSSMQQAWGQSNAGTQEATTRKKGHSLKETVPAEVKDNSLSAVAKKAEAAFETDEAGAAQSFIRLADELSAKGSYGMAETNYERAITILKRSGSPQHLAEAQRKLAKVQEELKKTKEATNNYRQAARNQGDPTFRELNMNDMNRVRSNSPEDKESFARHNLEVLSQAPGAIPTPEAKTEIGDALRQLAHTQRLQEKNEEALKTLSRAMTTEGAGAAKTEKAAKELTQELVREKQFDAAIELQSQLLKSADSSGDLTLKINSLLQLGKLYADQKIDHLAEDHFLSAYRLASSGHITRSAKDAVQALTSFYREREQTAKAQRLSDEFIQSLDGLLEKDSGLIDMKTLGITEKRIQRLEQEKALQASVIRQTRRNNYLLAAIAVLIFISLGVLGKAYIGILKRNKKIRLQSLRREMNPHFVFNSLNSINQFIAENDEIKANKYLNSYSTLMRSTMEQSGKDFVPLALELDHLQKYLSLEHQRFSHQFDYDIEVDDKLDRSAVAIPNMIIQPFLENAIWHGLRYKAEKGALTLRFLKRDKALLIEIEDDGIGIKQSEALKTVHQKRHGSLGMANTKERIILLNDLYHSKIDLTVRDLSETGKPGTIVSICLPI